MSNKKENKTKTRIVLVIALIILIGLFINKLIEIQKDFSRASSIEMPVLIAFLIISLFYLIPISIIGYFLIKK